MLCVFTRNDWNFLSGGYGLVIGFASLAAYAAPLVRITVIKCQHLAHTALWVKFKRWRKVTFFCGVAGIVQLIMMVTIKAHLDSRIIASPVVPKPLELWVCTLAVLCITSILTILGFLWLYAQTERAAKND